MIWGTWYKMCGEGSREVSWRMKILLGHFQLFIGRKSILVTVKENTINWPVMLRFKGEYVWVPFSFQRRFIRDI